MGRTTKRVKPIFAKNATALTKARGWNWHELARRARMSHSTVRDILSGLSPGLEENRKAIAEALDHTMADLYLDPSNPGPNPPPNDPGWKELSRILQSYLGAGQDRRLLALYILTDDESYLTQYEKLPDAPPIAAVLKKVL